VKPQDTPEDGHKREIVSRARGRRTLAERTAYLDGACGVDTALRAEVEALLANDELGDGSGGEVPAPETPDTGHAPGEAVATVHLGGGKAEGAGAVIGRYRLLGQLGEGGFGSVWAAEQREPVRRRVALKIIKLGMDTRQVVARFEAERQALALMDHPNIAKVLDAGATDTGRPYFVMELVRGIPITHYCDRERLTVKGRLKLFLKVCHAIQHAHQKGIIHRDIKPSNILVTSHDGIPVPKVIDFGIAKATQQALTEKTIYTQFSQFIGTPSYTSPEQAEMGPTGAGDIDTRADIYSLGVLLYELLAGHTPFDGQQLIQSGLDEMRRVIREEEPPRPSIKLASLQGEERSMTAASRGAEMPRLIARLRGDLDWIVMKCLEKDRTRRYDTANGLAADLQRHLDHEPVTAMPPSTVYRLRKSWKRNRLAYSAAATVVLALIAGLGLATWAFVRENQAQLEQSRLRIEAEAARATANAQRDLARNRLYQSLVREARSIRQARQVGYRREVFDRLQQALALQTPDLDLGVLRREAVACLGDWVGLDPLDIELKSVSTADALVTDGSLLALATVQGSVTLHETGNGREVAVLQAAGLPVSLAFDRLGSRLLVLMLTSEGTPAEQLQSATLESWSRQSNGSWHRAWQRAAPGVFALAASLETPLAIRLDANGSALELVDPAADALVARVPTEAQFPESPRAALSSDGKFLAFFTHESPTNFDAEVEIWNLETSRKIASLKPQLGRGFGLSFGPEGRTFAETAGATLGGTATLAVPSFQEQTVHLIDLLSGSQMASLTSPGSLQAARFSEDGRILLVRHASGCRILHLDVDEEKIQFDGHQGGVPAVEFSPAGTQLASTGKDRTVRLWDLEAPYACRVLGPLPAAGQSLAYHPDGRLLACADYATGRLSLWSPETGQWLGELGAEPPQPGAIWSCHISADGKYLAAVGGGLRVWRLNVPSPLSDTAATLSDLLFTEPRGEANVVFHPDGQTLAYLDILSAGDRFVTGIYLRDLKPDAAPWLVTSNSQASIIQIHSFLPRSGRLLYVNRDREIVLVDPATGENLRQFPTLAPGETPSTYIGNTRVSPDESKLAMVSSSGLGVDLWDLTTGRNLYSLPNQPGSVWWLSWSPDSRRLAVSRANGAIAVWDTATVEARLVELGLE